MKQLPSDLPTHMHATSVAAFDKGVLIIGPSGSGKSSLALGLMAFGAVLISDDLTWLDRRGDAIILSQLGNDGAGGLIEARGLGLLKATLAEPCPLHVVIDLGSPSPARLPVPASAEIAGLRVPVFQKVNSPAFPAMIWQYLKEGMHQDIAP